MIGRYALPSDDLGPYAVSVVASAEDSEYLAANLMAFAPSRPAKLTTQNGNWVVDFGVAINVAAVALIYHNIEPGVAVLIQANSSNSWGSPPISQSITIPDWTADRWPVSPWAIVTGSPTYRYWRLVIDGSPGNSLPVTVGRLLLVGALHDLGDQEGIEQDVRWGIEEAEDHGLVEMATELDVETIYALGGKRRTLTGECVLYDSSKDAFTTLVRSALGRVNPWLLIPDITVNDAWMVRFEESRWSRVRQSPGQNILPFHVKELSRGLPWP